MKTAGCEYHPHCRICISILRRGAVSVGTQMIGSVSMIQSKNANNHSCNCKIGNLILLNYIKNNGNDVDIAVVGWFVVVVNFVRFTTTSLPSSLFR